MVQICSALTVMELSCSIMLTPTHFSICVYLRSHIFPYCIKLQGLLSHELCYFTLCSFYTSKIPESPLQMDTLFSSILNVPTVSYFQKYDNLPSSNMETESNNVQLCSDLLCCELQAQRNLMFHRLAELWLSCKYPYIQKHFMKLQIFIEQRFCEYHSEKMVHSTD